MYRKGAPTELYSTAPDRDSVRPQARQRSEPTRWPLGVSLTIALAASLALWAAAIAAALTLVAMF